MKQFFICIYIIAVLLAFLSCTENKWDWNKAAEESLSRSANVVTDRDKQIEKKYEYLVTSPRFDSCFLHEKSFFKGISMHSDLIENQLDSINTLQDVKVFHNTFNDFLQFSINTMDTLRYNRIYKLFQNNGFELDDLQEYWSKYPYSFIEEMRIRYTYLMIIHKSIIYNSGFWDDESPYTPYPRPFIISNSLLMEERNEYKAEIFLAIYSNLKSPRPDLKVTVNESEAFNPIDTLDPFKQKDQWGVELAPGEFIYTCKPSSIGEQKLEGKVFYHDSYWRIKQPDTVYTFSGRYYVEE